MVRDLGCISIAANILLTIASSQGGFSKSFFMLPLGVVLNPRRIASFVPSLGKSLHQLSNNKMLISFGFESLNTYTLVLEKEFNTARNMYCLS